VTNVEWWRSAAIYQIYPRSFADDNGDGVGDLAGIRAHLGYLAELGVDAVWFNPWYVSPMADAGYDVADHRDIDPLFGTLAEAEALMTEAHHLGIRIIVDVVPNHCSDAHPWFQQALAAQPGSAERERFWFRPGRGEHGELPPNNWQSIFGGPAWTRTTDPGGSPGEWYLHLFAPAQPDLNWQHPKVREEFEDLLRFWFDRGADGVRIDSAALLAKDPDLADLDPDNRQAPHPFEARDEVHDVIRHVTRYGRADTRFSLDYRQIGAACDLELGTRRARAAVLLLLALPGSAYLYQGEELGLYEVEDILGELRQDPMFHQTNGVNLGRDGCRIPLPWHGDAPPFGFSPPDATASPWLPQPDDWSEYTVQHQRDDPNSMLRLYQRALHQRRAAPALGAGTLQWLDAPPDVLAFTRGHGFTCVVNLSPHQAPMPPHVDIILASQPLTDSGLPSDCAAWLRTA
jgi:alpha-glucosidase